jgi:flagellar hook assembly protein FlgD
MVFTLIPALLLPEAGEVELTVFNLLGRQVRMLIDKTQPSGSYDVQWNGTDERGNQVSRGVDLYRLRFGKTVVTKQLIFLE